MKKHASQNSTKKSLIVTLILGSIILMIFVQNTSSKGLADEGGGQQESIEVIEAAANESIDSRENGEPSLVDSDLVAEIQREIGAYYACSNDDRCLSAHDSDPREREFALVDPLIAKSQSLVAHLEKNPKESEELSQLARALLKITDGRLKAIALQLMLTQEVDPANVEAVGAYVLQYHDSNLIELGVRELSRHLQGREASEIQSFVVDVLKRGSLFVRRTLSEQILPLINEESYPHYEALLTEPSLDPQVRRHLKSSLEEWRMRVTRG